MTKIAGKYVAVSEICKIVKAPLVKRWGGRRVSVRKGTGTSASWIYAEVDCPKSSYCVCKPNGVYCSNCQELRIQTKAEAEKLVEHAMKKAKAEFSTFWDDENVECNNFILTVYINRYD